MPLNINYISDLLNYEKLQSGLYIVSTPIGNLSDITLRALKVLSSVDIILCEDTRISKRLTIKYGINTKLTSFHKFNTRKIIPSIITKLSKAVLFWSFRKSKSLCLYVSSSIPFLK